MNKTYTFLLEPKSRNSVEIALLANGKIISKLEVDDIYELITNKQFKDLLSLSRISFQDFSAKHL